MKMKIKIGPDGKVDWELRIQIWAAHSGEGERAKENTCDLGCDGDRPWENGE
jgi:hypothetical protein